MKTSSEIVNRFMMLSINVSDMAKARSFYVDKLGLKITTDNRLDDNNWWVSLIFPKGGATMTLARSTVFLENIRPGMLSIYFETSDVVAAHKELSSKDVKINGIQDDLFGPGSGVKFFNFNDPDGNLVHIVQAHPARAPF